MAVRRHNCLHLLHNSECRAALSAVTAAGLRLLPLLAPRLSVPEIAGELFLSPHTIKSQMKSIIYRKLGSSTGTQTSSRPASCTCWRG